MNSSVADTEQLVDVEIATLLLDEWKWRHQHCWKSLQRYCLAALTITLIPYVWLLRESTTLPEPIPPFKTSFGSLVLVFPFASLILAQAAIWLFASEYIRCRSVEAMYNTILGTYSPNVVSKTTTLSMKKGVGQLTVIIVGALSALLTFGNICVLVLVATLTVKSNVSYLFWTILSVITIGIIYADFRLANWAKEEVTKRIKSQQKENHRTVNST